MSTELEKKFAERGPWVTRFNIGDRSYGGQLDLMNDPRLQQFADAFPDVQTVLELGSLEGAHTFGLARLAQIKRVVGIEGREANFVKARWVQGLLNVPNAEFVLGNLESMDLAAGGHFDAAFCCGLLYHLPEPWNLIGRLPEVSPNLFLWTHYAWNRRATITVHGLRGMAYQEQGLADPLSGMSPSSFWPTLDSLVDLLRQSGYRHISLIDVDPRHVHGPAVTLAASCMDLGPAQRRRWAAWDRNARWREWYSRVRDALRVYGARLAIVPSKIGK